MDFIALIQPRRSLAVPFVVVLYPLLWLVVRGAEVTAVGRPITETLPQVLGLTAIAVIISYSTAVLVATVLPLGADSVPAWARSLVTPTNATLTLVSVFSLALGAYIIASSMVELPQWFDSVASITGLIIGWPMMLLILGSYALGNAFPAFQNAVVAHLLIGMFGVALSAVWLFLLSGWITGLVPPTVPRATTR